MTSSPIKLLLMFLTFSMPIMADQFQGTEDIPLFQEDTLWQEPIDFDKHQPVSPVLPDDVLTQDSPEDDISIVPHNELQKPEDSVFDDENSIENSCEVESSDRDIDENPNAVKARTISAIIVQGNKNVPTDAILNKIPYHLKDIYSPLKSKQLISNLIDMGYFKNVEFKGENVGKDGVNLYIIVSEKSLLKDVVFIGNKSLPEKDIKKKINFTEKPGIDEYDLKKYSLAIKKLYKEKNFHHAEVEGELKPEEGTDRVIAVFNVKEHRKSSVQRVFFEGNKAFTSKELRGLIFTREDWILGFMDRAGSYQPEAIDSDRHTLENFYQSNGYLNAKVTHVDVVPDQTDLHTLKITFHIEEGDLYTIDHLAVNVNDVVPQDLILSRLPIRVGNLYSKDKIRDSIELIRLILGEYGYIYADVDPAVEPHDENKTVSITFYTELGDKITLRKIEIRGNQKTRQKIIRRQLLFDEGDLLTSNKLEQSKERIEQLGYFDQQNGVSWKIKRINREIADLELFVREVKTGRIDAQLGFGGSPRDLQNPTESLRIGGSISDTNLFGLGIGLNLSGEFSKQERQLLFNITEPWLFDRPIFTALDVAIKKSIYEDFQFTKDEVKEQLVNGSLSLGCISQSLMTKFVFLFGVEGLHYNKPPEVNTSAIPDPKEAAEFSMVLSKRFPQGSFAWTGAQASQDFRNHPMHPSRGYQWLGQTRLGIPNRGQFHIASSPGASPFNFGFCKFDFDASYYTPLIGERDLVFYFHTHLGYVTAIGHNVIPFRELYHIGGPASVRGFLFGEIGPTFKGVDSIGAKKAFWLNAELIFPVAPDFSIKGIFFYDGGAGWDTPDAEFISRKRLKNNHFNYRHSVGFGVRLLRPTPVRIDWGFKLDRRKGEKVSEVHLSMSHDF